MTYNKKLKTLARSLRKNGTMGEAILWRDVLSRKQFYAYQFNRQFPIQNYIVDFICRKLKLVIEVDGSSHQDKVEQDELRDQELNYLGYRVLRVSEKDVRHDLLNVIRSIEMYLPD